MTNRELKNVAASVKSRLLSLARSTQKPYQELLQYYGMERFLYRLSQSSYSSTFVLKGALLFYAWKLDDSRATLDIDLLAKTKNSKDNLLQICRDVCELDPTIADGVEFDSDSITCRTMQHDAKYPGVRLRFTGRLEATRIPMQIDVGFGDIVTPAPRPLPYPSLLDFPDIHLHSYSPETVIAEKLETMIQKGMANTRIKDFYDVWLLSDQATLNHTQLPRAIGNTFAIRRTTLHLQTALDLLSVFGNDSVKDQAWQIFREKHRLVDRSPAQLSDLTAELATWLQSLDTTNGIDGNI